MKQIFLSTLILLFGGISATAFATPSRVILIRHAEKPDGDAGPDLTVAGYARANALVGFFATNATVAEKGEPQFIFAKFDNNSNPPTMRAIETVAPLAQALGITTNTTGNGDLNVVAKAVLSDPMYDGKIVLICWDHSEMPDLAQALGMSDAPAKWKGAVYDRFWVADYNSDGSVGSFQDLPQHLMPGDSSDSVYIEIHL